MDKQAAADAVVALANLGAESYTDQVSGGSYSPEGWWDIIMEEAHQDPMNVWLADDGTIMVSEGEDLVYALTPVTK